MIKTKNGRTKVKGNMSELATNLAHATAGVVDALSENMPREVAVEIAKRAVEVGLMTDEELREKAEEQKLKLFRAMAMAFDDERKEEEGEQADE